VPKVVTAKKAIERHIFFRNFMNFPLLLV